MDRPSLMPADTPDFMAPAWASCMSWAIVQPNVLAAFRAETGNTWTPGKTGLEQAIDSASGADRAFMEAFITWANVNVWGPIDRASDAP